MCFWEKFDFCYSDNLTCSLFLDNEINLICKKYSANVNNICTCIRRAAFGTWLDCLLCLVKLFVVLANSLIGTAVRWLEHWPLMDGPSIDDQCANFIIQCGWRQLSRQRQLKHLSALKRVSCAADIACGQHNYGLSSSLLSTLTTRHRECDIYNN